MPKQNIKRDGPRPSRFSALVRYQQTFLTTLALLLFSAQITLKAEDESNLYSDEELYEMLFRDTSPEPPNKKKIKWTPSYTFETGVGFSDNPLYGPFVQEEATFWENSLEGFYLIESQPEFFTYLYLYGEGKIFEELPEHNTNSIYLGQFEHAYTPSESSHTYGFRIRYTYYNQAFDFSELGLPYSLSITSDKSEIIPYLSHEISNNIIVTMEILLANEDFKSITDDNEDVGISLILKGSPDILNWKFQSEYIEKKYQERILKTEKVNLALTFEKDLKQESVRNSKAKLLWTNLQDDGGGYYDYEKLSLSLRQEFKISTYEIEFSLGGAQTKYDRRLT
ncbi:MAG: hypothetical protein EBU27_10665, partial [Opitutae bacterium]|nr:hypothetical protein [Opitutae bacterium]